MKRTEENELKISNERKFKTLNIGTRNALIK